MAFRLPSALPVKKILSRLAPAAKKVNATDVPKGFLAVYVGESQKKRYLIPVSYVNKPQFQQLLRKSEADFGFHHPMGGLTIHCREDIFLDITSNLSR